MTLFEVVHVVVSPILRCLPTTHPGFRYDLSWHKTGPIMGSPGPLSEHTKNRKCHTNGAIRKQATIKDKSPRGDENCTPLHSGVPFWWVAQKIYLWWGLVSTSIVTAPHGLEAHQTTLA